MNPQQPGPSAPLPPQYTPPPMPQPPFPAPPSPGAPQDPYSFIMDPVKKKPPRGTTGGGISQNPFITKILMIAGGAVVLMIAAGFLINIFFGDKTNLDDILSLAQQQQEIIRVSDKIVDSTSQATKNATASTEATVTSQQQDMLIYLAQHGRKKIPAKELSLKQNLTTDKRLTQAQATSTFDIVYKQVMRTQLETYAAALKTAHTASSSTKEKALLAKDYNEVQVLLEQWPSSTTGQ